MSARARPPKVGLLASHLRLDRSEHLCPTTSSHPSADTPPIDPAIDGPFTVVVRGRSFVLTREQITYDAPNLFTDALLDGNFLEQRSGRLVFESRSPELFELIVEYLSGYPILPVREPAKLLTDCEYYGLDRLRDLLSLPIVGPAVSSRYAVRKTVRFEDVVSGRLRGVVWTKDGLVEAQRGAVWHVMVFMTGASFKLDITVRPVGECSQAVFGIELPAYASSLRSKPLHLREGGEEWTAVMAEPLSATPLVLDEGRFDGNFGDIVKWMASFLTRFSPSRGSSSGTASGRPMNSATLQDPEMTDTLSQIMPGLAEKLRAWALAGNTVLKLSTSFWASELCLIIAPFASGLNGVGDSSGMAAHLLNCSLSTGLSRRRALRPIVKPPPAH